MFKGLFGVSGLVVYYQEMLLRPSSSETTVTIVFEDRSSICVCSGFGGVSTFGACQLKDLNMSSFEYVNLRQPAR